MAIIRQPSSDPVGSTYLRVLGDQLGTNQISWLQIHCSNGVTYNTSIEGGTTGNYRTTTQTFTGLQPGTQYGFYISGQTTGGTAIRIPSSGWTYFTTLAPPAPTSPSVSTGSINGLSARITVTVRANTTGIQIRPSWGSTIQRYRTSGTEFIDVTVPSYNTYYTYEVRAFNDYYFSDWVTYGFYSGSPPDPYISGMSITGENAINISWTVANAGSMRTTNSFRIYMSGANNTTQYDQGYLQSGARSWSKGTDGSGSALVVGATYTVWIAVYSSGGTPSALVSRSVKFSKTRPLNFNYTGGDKVANTQYNLTQNDWNALLNKINEFRGYRGLSQITTFNRNVVAGALPYIEPKATSYQQAKNAIETMSPSTIAPSVSSGDIIAASILNTLKNSLNSIT